jgi:hypothetical protein
MFKTIPTVIVIFMLGFSIQQMSGQTVSREVVSTAGDHQENQGYSLSWTLGETTTESFVKGDELVTQGFHQPYLYQITDIPDPGLTRNYQIEVYPNPAEYFFYVEFDPSQEREPLELILFNTAGSKIYETSLDPGIHKYKINIQNFASDMFQMIITDEERSYYNRFKILKLNK